MNKKGFTLIELIVTIALLGIIAVVSFVSITEVIKENHNHECKNLETSIKNATKSYISDNRYKNNSWNQSTNVEITAKVLLDNNYLIKEIVNPYSKETINPETIEITIDIDESYNPVTITVNGLPNNCQR